MAYFGRQSDYYLSKYKAYHAGDKFTFNIGAFFFGLFWFLYRKLFIEFWAIIGLVLVTSVVEVLVFDAVGLNDASRKPYDYLLMFAFATAYGFIGNYLYIKKADKKIAGILAETENEDERIHLLHKKGGVSPAPFIVVGVLVALMVGVAEYMKRYQ